MWCETLAKYGNQRLSDLNFLPKYSSGHWRNYLSFYNNIYQYKQFKSALYTFSALSGYMGCSVELSCFISFTWNIRIHLSDQAMTDYGSDWVWIKSKLTFCIIIESFPKSAVYSGRDKEAAKTSWIHKIDDITKHTPTIPKKTPTIAPFKTGQDQNLGCIPNSVPKILFILSIHTIFIFILYHM